MYYVLDTDGRENVLMTKEQGLNSHVELGMGISWDVNNDGITLPYRYQMTVATGQTPRLYGWYPGSDLMQQELVDTLQSVGVDNLQLFPTEIRRADSDEEILGYVTLNIIGRIACAAMTQSTSSPIADVSYFHHLVINPKKIQGQLMFRVHESPMIVLVHESIAAEIEKRKFIGVTLKKVAEAVDGI
jgi:hypothetical protein